MLPTQPQWQLAAPKPDNLPSRSLWSPNARSGVVSSHTVLFQQTVPGIYLFVIIILGQIHKGKDTFERDIFEILFKYKKSKSDFGENWYGNF